eukprot:6043903-Prymnesium_polylepis.1
MERRRGLERHGSYELRVTVLRVTESARGAAGLWVPRPAYTFPRCGRSTLATNTAPLAMGKPTLRVGAETQRWSKLASVLPCGDNKADATARNKMFSSFDSNGNGFLSLTEVERAMRPVMGEKEVAALHEHIKKAFNMARVSKKARTEFGDDFVDPREFRKMLMILKRHFFTRMLEDMSITSQDSVDKAEFSRIVRLLTAWKVNVDPVREFDAVDALKPYDYRGTGVMSWSDFLKWVKGVHLDIDDLEEEEEHDDEDDVFKMKEPKREKTVLDSRLPDVIARLPCRKFAEGAEEARERMFKTFDLSGNGFISLGAAGLNDALDLLSPAITRAFHAAKDARTAGQGEAAQYVTRGEEFRLLLVFLMRYFELLRMFDIVDTNNDRRIDLKEFQAALPALERWGVRVVDAKAEFAKIDKDGGGRLLFDEFSGWRAQNSHPSVPPATILCNNAVSGESELVTQHKTSQPVSDEEAKFALERRKMAALAQEKRHNNVRDQTKDVDIASFIRKLPIGENAGEIQRKLFSRFDVNGNGHLSLSEVELGLRMMMGSSGETVVDALGPAIARAFHAAKDSSTAGSSQQFVEFTEFRLLLVYLKRYTELLRLFDMIDTTDDRRINFQEFQAAMPQLQRWGVIVEDAAAEFAKMDADKSGKVLFDEFSGCATWSRTHLCCPELTHYAREGAGVSHNHSTLQ